MLQRDKSLKFVFKLHFFIPILLVISAFNTAIGKNQELSFDAFFQEDGLPNNFIQCIYQDSKGWMWIGTSQGLSRFDGYNFVNYLPNSNDSTSLEGNLVRVITEDKNGNLWIGTENGGLNLYQRNLETFSQPFNNHPDLRFKHYSVNDIIPDGHGNTWVGTDFGIMVIDSVKKMELISPQVKNKNSAFPNEYVRRLQFDNQGNLWIGTNSGLFIYSPKTNLIETFPLPFEEGHPHEIWEIYRDEEGLMWVGTYSLGLFIIDPEKNTTKHIKLYPEVERSETVRSVSKSGFGEYWIGTRGGLYVYSKAKGITGFYRHDERRPRSLTNNSVLSIIHDKNDETWIGTRGGLNLLARSKQVFHNFTALPNDNFHLNSSIVYAIWVDKKGNIWLGTEDGGINIYNTETGKYTYLMADDSRRNSLSQNCIKAFEEDDNGNLWVGTFLGGIDVIHLATGKITHHKHDSDNPQSLSDNRVWDICKDKNGNLWIGTTRGLDRYNVQKGTFSHYTKISGEDQISWVETDSEGNLWLGSPDEVIVYNEEKKSIHRFQEQSRSMFEDSKNNVWIATLDKGIAKYNATSGPVQYFNEMDGLANNQALCIQEDRHHNLWISTSNGLSKFNVQQNTFHNFSSNDGLGNNQFCYRASYETPNGDLLFGSISGFNMFNPDDVTTGLDNVPIVFTDLKIFNKSVPVSQSANSVLKQSISETNHLVLNYDQNVFTLDFAALNYINSDKNLYSYKLEGFNKDWNEPSKTHSATYTNLNPGKYTLKIKRAGFASGNDAHMLQLKITVLPPFWKTRIFLILLLLVIAALIYVLVRFIINREKIKNQLVLERINSKKLHEIDMMKLKFFTNISHEIRTPLTLILGPLEKLLGKNVNNDEIQENLHLMHRNAKNLDKLMSQLLDFRKLQTGNLKLNLTQADIVTYVRHVVESFEDYAKENGIHLKFNTLKKGLVAVFDPDKLEKIINNLISNAFKFTEAGGTISVNLSLVFDTNDNDFDESEKDKQFIEISVKDTGKGIASKDLNRIFQRFFQSDGEPSKSGVGIGLALVKELVEIHKGNVFVTSKPGRGTKFTFRIPYLPNLKTKTPTHPSIPADSEIPTNELATENSIAENSDQRMMLIVEDNADVRSFIAAHFRADYKILEAKNGEEGWQTAVNMVPNVIVSDVLMPDVDGFELCKRLKNDERTSHIPVILLTALHSKEHEIKGLSTGADDYITKPFDLNILQAKIDNILSIRDSLKEKFGNTMVLEPTNVVLTSPDERFLQKAIDVVEENISDPELDIENFASKVGVSRMQLYRKLNALTNMTVKEFIRHLRLKRATQLLVQQKMNISEVAYEVGFKDLSHFRKCFKREYGMSASEYVAKSKTEEQN